MPKNIRRFAVLPLWLWLSLLALGLQACQAEDRLQLSPPGRDSLNALARSLGFEAAVGYRANFGRDSVRRVVQLSFDLPADFPLDSTALLDSINARLLGILNREALNLGHFHELRLVYFQQEPFIFYNSARSHDFVFAIDTLRGVADSLPRSSSRFEF